MNRTTLMLGRGTWEVCATGEAVGRAIRWFGNAMRGFEVEYEFMCSMDTFESFIRSLRPECLPKLLAEVQMHEHLNPSFSKTIAKVLGDT